MYFGYHGTRERTETELGAMDYSKSYLIETNSMLPMAVEIAPENGKTFALPELYRLLDCDTIQILQLENPDRWLIIDEEGKIKDRPINSTATVLARLYPHDVIVGHAIVCPCSMLE
jgi:hypothetical protein